MTNVYLADTYALIEIINGNKNYHQFISSILLTTKLHVMELYYILLKDFNMQTADRFSSVYFGYCIPITFTSMQYAMEFKLQHKKEKLSYADCIGYALARELRIPFLTGDKTFEKKENVEFVK